MVNHTGGPAALLQSSVTHHSVSSSAAELLTVSALQPLYNPTEKDREKENKQNQATVNEINLNTKKGNMGWRKFNF